jgi:hypothetical protein
MKKINLGFVKNMGVLVICLTVISLSSLGQKKDMTVSGEVVDMSCYMASGAHGEGHRSCAATCIKDGSPMGILTDDGKVYLLVENHDKKEAYAEAKKHAGEQVTVTGSYAEKGGVQGLAVTGVKAKA